MLFGRPPGDDERATIAEYLTQVRAKLAPEQREAQAWESVVRALWISNEFVYVD